MSREGVHVPAAHYLIFLVIFNLRWSLRQPCWQTTSMRFFRAIYSFFLILIRSAVTARAVSKLCT